MFEATRATPSEFCAIPEQRQCFKKCVYCTEFCAIPEQRQCFKKCVYCTQFCAIPEQRQCFKKCVYCTGWPKMFYHSSSRCLLIAITSPRDRESRLSPSNLDCVGCEYAALASRAFTGRFPIDMSLWLSTSWRVYHTLVLTDYVFPQADWPNNWSVSYTLQTSSKNGDTLQT
jgi:hypothetical protein